MRFNFPLIIFLVMALIVELAIFKRVKKNI